MSTLSICVHFLYFQSVVRDFVCKREVACALKYAVKIYTGKTTPSSNVVTPVESFQWQN